MSVSRKDKFVFLSPLQAMCKNRSFLENPVKGSRRDPKTISHGLGQKKSSVRNLEGSIKSGNQENPAENQLIAQSPSHSPDCLQKTQDINFYNYKQSFAPRSRHKKKVSVDTEYSLKVDFNGLFNFDTKILEQTGGKVPRKLENIFNPLPQKKSGKFYQSVHKSNRNLSTQISHNHNNSRTNNKLSYIEEAAAKGKMLPLKLEIKNFKLKDARSRKAEDVLEERVGEEKETLAARLSNSRKNLLNTSSIKRNMASSVSKELIRENSIAFEEIQVFL